MVKIACGIQAVINLKGLTKNDLRHFTRMMVQLETRGTDATGLADQNLNMIKRPMKASKFVKTKMYKNFVNRAIGQKWIIGHARRTTKGDAKINSNNHPMSKMPNKYYLIHNGVVQSTTIQNPVHISDTHIISKALAKHWKDNDLLTTMKKAYTEFSGVATIIVTTKTQIGFARATHPLHVGILPSMAYAIASTPEILSVRKIPEKIVSFDDKHAVVLNLNGKTRKVELKMQKRKEIPISQYNRYFETIDTQRYLPPRRTGIISYDYYGNPIYTRERSWIERQDDIARRNRQSSLRGSYGDVYRKPVEVKTYKKKRSVVRSHRRTKPRRR